MKRYLALTLLAACGADPTSSGNPTTTTPDTSVTSEDTTVTDTTDDVPLADATATAPDSATATAPDSTIATDAATATATATDTIVDDTVTTDTTTEPDVVTPHDEACVDLVWSPTRANSTLVAGYQIAPIQADTDPALELASISYSQFLVYDMLAYKRFEVFVDPESFAYPNAIATGDIDGDGDDDLIGAYDDDGFFVGWWDNHGASPDDWGDIVPIGSAEREVVSLVAIDMDHDGDLDVAGAVGSILDDEQSVVWWERTSTTWVVHTLSSHFEWVSDLAAADMDRDGDLDLVGSAAQELSLRWWRPSGQTFVEEDLLTNTDWIESVTPADLDGDGDDDLIVAYNADDFGVDRLEWLENGDGWRSHLIGYETGEAHTAAADLDGDGDLDIGAASYYEYRADWFANSDNGESWLKREIDSPYSFGSSDAQIDSSEAIVAADFDGDGRMDLATGNGGDWSPATLFRNSGAMSSEKTTERDIGGFSADDLVGFDSGDIDGDGDLDFVSASNASSEGLTWWRHGQGFFEPLPIDAFPDARAVALHDVDGDHDLDVVAGRMALDTFELAWFERAGAGWTKHPIATTQRVVSLAIGDLDGDHDDDIVVATLLGNSVVAFMHDGGTWTEKKVGDLPLPTSVALADLDGDTDLDVVAASGTSGQTARWWENAATWTVHETQSGASEGAVLTTGDLDGDHDVDLVFAFSTRDAFEVALNASGTFTSTMVSFDVRRARGIRARDVDEDGDLDLVFAEHTLNRLSWFENYLGTGLRWVGHHPNAEITNASWVDAVDVDDDGTVDLVGCGEDTIADFVWLERELVCE